MKQENVYRFCITLNRGDPLHRTAIDALTSQGRRKSQFVATAIAEYLMGGKGQVQTVLPDTESIREICREVIREYMERERGKEERVMRMKREETVTDEDSDLSEELDFTVFENAMSEFRKK